MQNAQPKFSIVTPAFNCAAYIRACIESVLAQNYENFEHIIADGGSKDGTVEILQEYPHLKWISEPDNGEAEALNKALKMADGDIIGWLNADDLYKPDIFHSVAANISPEADRHAVYGDTDYIDENDALIMHQKSTSNLSMKAILSWWRYEFQPIPRQPSIFYSRQLMDDIGLFKEDLYYSIDYDHMLRTAVKYRFHYIDQTLSVARIRPECKSAEDMGAQYRMFMKISRPYYRYVSAWERLQLRFEYSVPWTFMRLIAPLRPVLAVRTRLRNMFSTAPKNRIGHPENS